MQQSGAFVCWRCVDSLSAMGATSIKSSPALEIARSLSTGRPSRTIVRPFRSKPERTVRMALAQSRRQARPFSRSVEMRYLQDPAPSKATSVQRTMNPSRASTTANPSETFGAVVVGAGPAGITAVGNLLENRVDRILWVDEDFNGGRINKNYREVPSNTKVKLFVEYAQGVSPFRKITSGTPSRDRWEEPSASDGVAVDSQHDKLQNLRRLEQDKGCDLSHAADMCLMLTEGLKKTPGVKAQQGRVSQAILDEKSGMWTVNVEQGADSQDATSVQAQRLVLCTGASPNDPPLPFEPQGLQHLHLDTALSPTQLTETLFPLTAPTVAVIGASHSAVLVLRNLANLALSTKPDLKIKWFTRHPLRYAEYEDGFIARDNTGLKGEAAQWARDNLEPETMPKSDISKVVTKIQYEKGHEAQVYKQHIPGCDFVVQAIGFTRNPTPALKMSDGREITPVFDHDKGYFNYVNAGEDASTGKLARLPGVYGAGIAFPERVVDKKYGHEEFNVGFFKFMNAVKKWAREWKPVQM